MTPSRYYIERLAQAFGYNRKVQHLGEAASEMHLLREAETQLGSKIWRLAEPIETLADDYWNLRKHLKSRDQIRERLNAAEGAFKSTKDSALEDSNPESTSHQEIIEKRQHLLDQQKEIALARESIMREGEKTRRLHKGLKTKLEVIREEDDATSQIESSEKRLAELKEHFKDLKSQNQQLTDQLAKGDQALDALNQQLKEVRSQHDAVAAKSMKAASMETKEIWAMRSELAALDKKIYQHFTVIGRYISRNVSHDPACAKAAKAHRGMIDVMRAIRRSIALNHRLAGTQTPN